MNVEHCQRILLSPTLLKEFTQLTNNVASLLYDESNGGKNDAVITEEEIAKRLYISKASVTNAKAELVKADYITVFNQTDSKGRRSFIKVLPKCVDAFESGSI